jgi:hypothetical protein
MAPRATNLRLLVVMLVGGVACRDNGADKTGSSGRSLPPVYPLGPIENTNWNPDAGPIMIVSTGADTVAVVIPEATDSTIASFQDVTPPISGLTFDLFGRSGKIGSSIRASPLSVKASPDCYSWPLAKLQSANTNWQVGFATGHVLAIKLDSIESMSSADSAALAASLAQTAALLPIASDPNYRGLPFRVRSAYTFRLDSIEVVVADVVRSVNEEANPRVEHVLIVGERPAGSSGKFNAGYFNRTAGAEESTQATEVLTAVAVGPAKRPAIVVRIEYSDGGKLGLIERTGPGQWRATWTSAYTDC